jgi:hypothetical protein
MRQQGWRRKGSESTYTDTPVQLSNCARRWAHRSKSMDDDLLASLNGRGQRHDRCNDVADGRRAPQDIRRQYRVELQRLNCGRATINVYLSQGDARRRWPRNSGTDSPVEERGFESASPSREGVASSRRGEGASGRAEWPRMASPFSGGTSGSNPLCSGNESRRIASPLATARMPRSASQRRPCRRSSRA